MPAAACAATRQGVTTFAARMPPSPEPGARGGAKPESCVHPQLWQACAGPLCTMPPVGAAVYYFPQGHAEQAGAAVDLRAAAGVPPFVPCRVVSVRFMAEPDTDVIFAKTLLAPLPPWEPVADAGDALMPGHQQQPPRPLSFAKTLTASDTNNGSSFSMPQDCAKTVFPMLDYSLDTPKQFVSVRDVHGVDWTFCLIYRGSPKRHLLTAGWNNFVNRKRLLPGDSVVFMREEDSKIHIGLRRAKRVFGAMRGNAGGPAAAAAGPSDGKVSAEDVVAAARLAGAGHPFEVVYYPRARAPEFCVSVAAVKKSMQVPWCPGLQFKMAFETDDLLRMRVRVSWFMGTIASVEAVDPAWWPESPWRVLKVAWDEPEHELLRNVNRVCPWLVELVPSMPSLPRFSPPPPRKKPRTPPYTESHSECRQLFDPAFLPKPNQNQPRPLAPPHPAPNHEWNRHGFAPSFPFLDSIAAAAGIQGARYPIPQFAPFFRSFHLSNQQQRLLFYGIHSEGHQAPPAPRIASALRIDGPTTRSPSPEAKKGDHVNPPKIMLFGRKILTQEQMKSSGSCAPTSPRATRSSSSNPDSDDDKSSSTPDRSGSDGTDGSPAKKNSPSLRLWWSGDSPASDLGLEPGQCKVFVESETIGRSLDLSALGSFDELCARLSSMFGINSADLRSRMIYRTIAGEVKHVGDEPFSAFVKSARRITIANGAGSDDTENP